MERFYQYLPQQLVHFVLVTLFSLLIGLSQRRLTLRYNNDTTHFGTDRTFTFIGILGYLLYILDAKSLQPWAMGGAALVVLLSLNYYTRMKKHEEYGITTIVIALITYCIAPIVCTQPSWFYVMMVVTVLLLTELKRTFKAFAEKMQHDEMITLAKFLAISGIILPMLPQEPLFP
nr:MgtC/SapB family protein [Bacteroidaceae bacterium]